MKVDVCHVFGERLGAGLFAFFLPVFFLAGRYVLSFSSPFFISQKQDQQEAEYWSHACSGFDPEGLHVPVGVSFGDNRTLSYAPNPEQGMCMQGQEVLRGEGRDGSVSGEQSRRDNV